MQAVLENIRYFLTITVYWTTFVINLMKKLSSSLLVRVLLVAGLLFIWGNFSSPGLPDSVQSEKAIYEQSSTLLFLQADFKKDGPSFKTGLVQKKSLPQMRNKSCFFRNHVSLGQNRPVYQTAVLNAKCSSHPQILNIFLDTPPPVCSIKLDN